jgi:hypothetical protein
VKLVWANRSLLVMALSLACTSHIALASSGSVAARSSSTDQATAVSERSDGPLYAASVSLAQESPREALLDIQPRMGLGTGDLHLRADGVAVDTGEVRPGGGERSASLLLASRLTTSSLAWQDMQAAPGSCAGVVPIRANGASGQGGGGGSSRGKAYMIAGGAAFIGGLIIGDTIGTVIAVGGLGLGVYGAVLYF